ncbi:unnamed protein product [Penicillium nalgiovense]|uniref:Uncharacterized protein n=1 Tax=Penicillium nalgiovense TaxID=60175 RepID=A0A1V6W3W3_PENNA|nr:hypothetical protein PENNAL_c0394G00195 [Penicillium nalgiovense]CAG8098713.1 unnamed protein product [Penicillium nalgiovense]CAG8117602.1 unnamed protein product [Penicillium nalgiovense]CAG8134959.1 unnamed protein product [Penicillium nalgiovense]CAG8136973.1 unnamed protein product [Penicillium nalgiovense]
MAKDHKPSRRGADRGPAITKPGTGRSCASSPCSARSTVSRSKAERNPLKAVGKHKGQGHSTAKITQKKDHEATHRKCLDVMNEIQKEFQLALEEIDAERTHDSQSMQRLHDEKAQGTSELQEAIIAKDKALVENQRLERELCQLQQAQESSHATMQGLVSWHDIQPALHQTHGELVSATTRFWNTIDALQNRRLASYLPSSGGIHGSWPEQDDPLGTLGHNALPQFSASSGYPLVNEEAPVSSNQY